MTIMFEGEPCRVIEFHHHTPGNLRAMVHAKLRKLKSGVTIEHRFRASDQMEEAVMETHTLQYLYHAGDTYHFMNTETYDQLEMDGEALGDAAQWMTDGMQIVAEFYNG
ncbi:MAG TPA: elongation factor P, partial [Gemmatimonadales bacterium]